MSNRFPADDEHLHPYPGNLKHHKVEKDFLHVEKEERRKLLCEMMEDDAKSGLYNKKKREPLLNDADRAAKAHERAREIHGDPFGNPEWMKYYTAHANGSYDAREIYEAARVKDAELIQRLVDAALYIYWTKPEAAKARMSEVLKAARAAGFKPSEP